MIGNYFLTLIVLIHTVFGEVRTDPPITDKVTFSIKQGDDDLGDVSLGLFGTVAPITVDNFLGLSNMSLGYGYQDVSFHRILKDFMVQGGDFENKEGRGGYSIYNKGYFKDENFIVKHDRYGRLSMANSGPNTNGAQFFITTCVADWLSGVHVVFGQLIGGEDVLDKIQSVKVNRVGKPEVEVKVDKIKIERYDRNGDDLQREEYSTDAPPSSDKDSNHKSHSLFFYFVLLVFIIGLIAVVYSLKYRNDYTRLKDIYGNMTGSQV